MNKINKILPIILFTVLILPQIALASWWNPFSWFDFFFGKKDSSHLQEGVLSDVGFISTSTNDDVVDVKVVKNIRKNEPQIVTGYKSIPKKETNDSEIKQNMPVENMKKEMASTSEEKIGLVNVFNVTNYIVQSPKSETAVVEVVKSPKILATFGDTLCENSQMRINVNIDSTDYDKGELRSSFSLKDGRLVSTNNEDFTPKSDPVRIIIPKGAYESGTLKSTLKLYKDNKEVTNISDNREISRCVNWVDEIRETSIKEFTNSDFSLTYIAVIKNGNLENAVISSDNLIFRLYISAKNKLSIKKYIYESSVPVNVIEKNVAQDGLVVEGATSVIDFVAGGKNENINFKIKGIEIEVGGESKVFDSYLSDLVIKKP
ncbi:MAG: hypothetical protein FGM57_02550 [Candidatus Taylorbacteria bacterium]|nr:hypothetical protein [Candidatus Taylorbacteria bacterium]